MRHLSVQKLIRPKISTMPRQKTEAAALLDLYKLVIEQNRLQEELQHIEARQQQIYQRLDSLNHHIGKLNQSVQQLRGRSGGDPVMPPVPNATQLHRESASPSTSTFDMEFLDY